MATATTGPPQLLGSGEAARQGPPGGSRRKSSSSHGVPLLRDEAEAQRRGPLSRGHTVRQGARPDSGVLATLDGFRVWGNLDLGPFPACRSRPL